MPSDLHLQAFSMTRNQDARLRESAFRAFVDGMLVMDLQPDAVLNALKGGLEDTESINVCKSPDITANHVSFVFTDKFPR
jgi:hypothetical protein